MLGIGPRNYGGIILKQLRKLGAEVRLGFVHLFTMDEVRSKSVLKVFVIFIRKDLYTETMYGNWIPATKLHLVTKR